MRRAWLRYISYLGAFTGAYREELLQKWVGWCREASVPVSADFCLRNTMADAVTIR
jgi:dynein heavy chain